MATFFKNKLIQNLGVGEFEVLSTNNNTRATVIGLSLSNLTDGITSASIRLENFWTISSATNTENEATITGVPDLDASRFFPGYWVSGTNVQEGTKVVSIVNNGVDDNTVTLSLPSLGGAIEEVTFTGTAYFARNLIVPQSQTLRLVNGGEKLVLGANMKMYVESNTADSLDFVCSYVEIV
jgi:hypothetical protein